MAIVAMPSATQVTLISGGVTRPGYMPIDGIMHVAVAARLPMTVARIASPRSTSPSLFLSSIAKAAPARSWGERVRGRLSYLWTRLATCPG